MPLADKLAECIVSPNFKDTMQKLTDTLHLVSQSIFGVSRPHINPLFTSSSLASKVPAAPARLFLAYCNEGAQSSTTGGPMSGKGINGEGQIAPIDPLL